MRRIDEHVSERERAPALTKAVSAAHLLDRFAECDRSNKLGQLLGHGAAELLGIDDGDGAPVIARHVMADADGDELDRRAQSRSPR